MPSEVKIHPAGRVLIDGLKKLRRRKEVLPKYNINTSITLKEFGVEFFVKKAVGAVGDDDWIRSLPWVQATTAYKDVPIAIGYIVNVYGLLASLTQPEPVVTWPMAFDILHAFACDRDLIAEWDPVLADMVIGKSVKVDDFGVMTMPFVGDQRIAFNAHVMALMRLKPAMKPLHKALALSTESYQMDAHYTTRLGRCSDINCNNACPLCLDNQWVKDYSVVLATDALPLRQPFITGLLNTVMPVSLATDAWELQRMIFAMDPVEGVFHHRLGSPHGTHVYVSIRQMLKFAQESNRQSSMTEFLVEGINGHAIGNIATHFATKYKSALVSRGTPPNSDVFNALGWRVEDMNPNATTPGLLVFKLQGLVEAVDLAMTRRVMLQQARRHQSPFSERKNARTVLQDSVLIGPDKAIPIQLIVGADREARWAGQRGAKCYYVAAPEQPDVLDTVTTVSDAAPMRRPQIKTVIGTDADGNRVRIDVPRPVVDRKQAALTRMRKRWSIKIGDITYWTAAYWFRVGQYRHGDDAPLEFPWGEDIAKWMEAFKAKVPPTHLRKYRRMLATPDRIAEKLEAKNKGKPDNVVLGQFTPAEVRSMHTLAADRKLQGLAKKRLSKENLAFIQKYLPARSRVAVTEYMVKLGFAFAKEHGWTAYCESGYCLGITQSRRAKWLRMGVKL